MNRISRRGIIAGTAGTAGALGAAGVAGAAVASDGSEPKLAAEGNGRNGPGKGSGGRGPTRVPSDDPRYSDLLLRRNNARFDDATPEAVALVGDTRDVVHAVQRAVDGGKRITVRSGGHCFENFVDDPGTDVIIDMSGMDRVRYDERRGAFDIEPGILLGDLYQRLYYGWGVTLPAGGCLGVGVGGHFSGGGYGPLSRLYGSVVDWIEAVEVVVVDDRGRARAVVASSNPRDRHHDLWWAHTGGGGGNFGVVTRFWMGDPSGGSSGSHDPSAHLPRPPETLLTNGLAWPWDGLDRGDFQRIVRNHHQFFERHAEPGSPYASLYSPLLLSHRSRGGLLASNQLDGTLPNAERLLDDYTAALAEGVSAEPTPLPTTPMPYLAGTLARSIAVSWDKTRHKVKAAYHRRGYTERQLGVLHDYLATDEQRQATVLFVPYGGQVNAVAPDATAASQRDSIMKMIFQVDWRDPAQDEDQIGWARTFYRELYADTGGVPVSNERTDGSYINYPDVDLADPKQNTSDVPWHQLYYKDNYPRLQRIKRAYDPGNVFRHALSVEPKDE